MRPGLERLWRRQRRAPCQRLQQGKDCTNGNCDRRADYLDAVTDLLIADLEWMTGQWAQGAPDNYRAQLTPADAGEGIQKMLFGMGSLSLGELAGERMKVALEEAILLHGGERNPPATVIA